MTEYRIIRNSEEYSNGDIHHYYTVEYKCHFLWHAYWRQYMLYHVWGVCDSSWRRIDYDKRDVEVRFKHKYLAEQFIKDLVDCESHGYSFVPAICRVNKEVLWCKPDSKGEFFWTYRYSELVNSIIPVKKTPCVVGRMKEVV